MRARSVCVLLAVALTSACQNSTPTAPPPVPTTAALALSISPNPLAVPAGGEKLVWNVTFRETAGIGIRIDRDEMVVVDSAGVKLAQRDGFYGSSCTQPCDGVPQLGANRSMTMSGMSASFRPARPGTFRYTVYFTDDRGNALSTTVTVPVM